MVIAIITTQFLHTLYIIIHYNLSFFMNLLTRFSHDDFIKDTQHFHSLLLELNLDYGKFESPLHLLLNF